MTFRAKNVISGKEARLFMNGEEIAYAKTFEAIIEKNKSEVPILRRRMMGYKATGATGTGTLTLYKVTSKFTRMMLDYIKTGEDAYFTLQGVLDDKGSGRGTERVTLFDCNIDSSTIGQFDVESEGLEEEVPFTFEDADLPESLRDTF